MQFSFVKIIWKCNGETQMTNEDDSEEGRESCAHKRRQLHNLGSPGE